MVDDPISLSIFWPKTPAQRARNDASAKHQAKFQVFSGEQPHLTLPIFPNNNAGSPCSRNSERSIFICPMSFRTFSSFVVFHVFPTLFKHFMPLKDTRLFHSIITISLC
jgi:hypothetical protein